MLCVAVTDFVERRQIQTGPPGWWLDMALQGLRMQPNLGLFFAGKPSCSEASCHVLLEAFMFLGH